ncbi:MAG TPA: glycosyltransferase family 4 protein [Tepidisphaeraceae bacterium]|nr:glycosyltransferase family 4 protein [Tepidisphaeraceae bacterium]
MNIALFPSAFYPSLGGVEELTRQLGLELQRQGHRVLIVTNRWPRDLPAAETIDGLDVRRLPMRVPTGHWKADLSYGLTHRQILRGVMEILQEFQPDVLHAQCVSSTTLYALRVRHILGIPLVVTLQGELTMDANGIFREPGIAQEILKQSLTEADLITGCSAKTLADATDRMKCQPTRRPQVIFNGARAEEFRHAVPHTADVPYVLALGRLVHQKGFGDLLKAIPQGLPAGWTLVLAGDGPLRSEIESKLGAIELKTRVRYIGRAERAVVCQYMAGCEFVVVPSLADEGLPVVCAEAIVAGKPIIGTMMGGIPEAVEHNLNGLLVPPNDPASLAAAIRSLASDAVRRGAMAQAAKARAAEFCWSSITQKYLAAYLRVMRASRRLPQAESRDWSGSAPSETASRL